MAKRAPRLLFTDEELANPAIQRASEKAEKAVNRLEKAEDKIPKKKVKQRVVDSNGKITTRISFEEKKPPSKLSHAAKTAPVDTLRATVHRNIRESNDDNAGVDAANATTETAESTYRIAETAHRSHQEKPYRDAAKAENAADKANLKALNKEYKLFLERGC